MGSAQGRERHEDAAEIDSLKTESRDSRRFSEPEPAGSVLNRFNIIDGWFRWLPFTLGHETNAS